MTIILPLEPREEARLRAIAQARGLSPEAIVHEAVDRMLGEQAASSPERVQTGRPLSARIREIWVDIPDDARAKLPADGASQHDHYIYGVPQREV